MSKSKAKAQYRDGTLGWWLMEAGWTQVEQTQCPRGGQHGKDQSGKCAKCHEFAHPLWRLEGFEKLLTGWEARRLELLRIHNDFKFKAKGSTV
jgi:hypothetical protein